GGRGGGARGGRGSRVRGVAGMGRPSEGWLCLPQGPMTWRVGVDEDVPGEVIAVLRDELQKAGYRTPAPPKSLFDDPKDRQAELLLAGALKGGSPQPGDGPHGRARERP